jgi:hypothetical protein
MVPAGSSAAADREPLAGLVERVTFHNADSGFCVLRVKASGKRNLITVLGATPSSAAGEYISGQWQMGEPPRARLTISCHVSAGDRADLR